jgi:hypothetical protein
MTCHLANVDEAEYHNRREAAVFDQRARQERQAGNPRDSRVSQRPLEELLRKNVPLNKRMRAWGALDQPDARQHRLSVAPGDECHRRLVVVLARPGVPRNAAAEQARAVIAGLFHRPLKQAPGVEDVSLDELTHVYPLLLERLDYLAMLLDIEGVELTNFRVPGPESLAVEDARGRSRRVCELRDAGGLQVDIVKVLVRLHPFACKGSDLSLIAFRGLERARQVREVLFGLSHLDEILLRQPITRERGRETFERCPDSEHLEQLVARQRPNLDASAASEGNEL